MGVAEGSHCAEGSELWAIDGERTGFLTIEKETAQVGVGDVNVITSERLTIDFNRLELRAVG